jgi:ubiquinone/menaquinone biosynthesis C-methylase UbiE
MERTVTQEILDSGEASPDAVAASLRDLATVNRWFGGVRTTRILLERVARQRKLSFVDLLDVASGDGFVPKRAAARLTADGVRVRLTFLDRHSRHLPSDVPGLVGDALELPFEDNTVDVVSSCLFLHHLEPEEVRRFALESLRVARHAVIINDIVRSSVNYVGATAFLSLLHPISKHDGLASIRRAYTAGEIRKMLVGVASRVEVSTHYFFRVGVILWKEN